MSGAIQVKTAEHLLLSTYEERGVAIPFTTPILGYARLRTDYRNRLEVSLGRFTDGEGYYVVRLETVPRLTTLTTHDTVLVEELTTVGVADPFRAKAAWLNAATSGLAGTEIAEQAQSEMARFGRAAAINRAAIALAAIPGDQPRPSPAELETAEGESRAWEAFSQATAGLPEGGNIALAWVHKIAAATSAFGIKSSPVPGPLRELMMRLATLRESWLVWASERLSTVADDARFCAEMADISLKDAQKATRSLDAKLGEAVAQTMTPPAAPPDLEALTRRLAFVLDGWEALVGLWLDGPAKSEAEAIAALSEIKSALPIPPREALDRTRRQQVARFVEHSRGWVRLNTDWLTGEIDNEALDKLENRKKGS